MLKDKTVVLCNRNESFSGDNFFATEVDELNYVGRVSVGFECFSWDLVSRLTTT